jgi:hypothetical protein
MWQEILRPTQGKVEILFGRPVVNLLLAEADSPDSLHLAQVDHVTGATTLRTISPALQVPQGNDLVPLASLLRPSIASPDMLTAIRGAVAAALHLDRVDCAILPSSLLQAIGLVASEAGPGPHTAPCAHTSWNAAGMAVTRSFITGAVRSSLPMWNTARALYRIYSHQRRNSGC